MQDRPLLIAALDRLRKAGAVAAEVLLSTTDWLEQTGSRSASTSGSSVLWTVHAWRRGGATGVGKGKTETEAVAHAMAASEHAPPDPNAGPAERQDVRAAGLSTFDRRYATIESADRVEVLDSTERCFERSRENVRLRSIVYRQERVQRSWASTRGVEATEQNTRFDLVGSVEAGASVAFSQRLASRHFSDVASLPFGTDLRRRAEPLARTLPGPCPGLPVLIEPRAFADLLCALAPAFAADHPGFLNVALAANPKGVQLAPALLHVTDDGGLHSGLHTVAFDDRGVTSVPLTLLREGRVASRYHSPETARAHRSRPTGHVRGAALCPSNLVVRPGARTRNMIHAELGDLLLLDAPPALDLARGRLHGFARVVHVSGGEQLGSFEVPFNVEVSTFFAALSEFAADQERHFGVDTPTAVLSRLPTE